MAKKRKKPLRKCVACGASKEKQALIRVVNNKEEGVCVDLSGKKNGRGAYLCKNHQCIQKAKKNRQLNQRLKTKIDENIYEELESYVNNDL
ncbi:MAG: YlxR family protein [Tissierellia bacterium]|nr:YlxR family protein [Tissierellia bacterium]